MAEIKIEVKAIVRILNDSRTMQGRYLNMLREQVCKNGVDINVTTIH